MLDLEKVTRLSRDLKRAAATMSDDEARYLVDSYYQMQANRIRADAQVRAQEGEPHSTLSWLSDQNATLEASIKNALSAYVASHPVGEWLLAVHGIGPVLAAGLLAHIDIRKAPTVGHIWRYAGLDPTVRLKKGEKSPYNIRLKVLCWKIGESFIKTGGSERSFYGPIYAQRKRFEEDRNARGENAEQAAEKLAKFNIGKTTEAYKHLIQGKLPPAQLHARARRYAVKIFLSHLHAEMYRRVLKEEPPKPFAISILGHAHMIEPPAQKTA